jgi:hypothetical protein
MTANAQPYRDSSIRPLCVVCREAAESVCARCGGTLCAVHQPLPDQRCPSCEDHFDIVVEDRKANPLLFHQVWLGYLAAVVATLLGVWAVDSLWPQRGWELDTARTLTLVAVALLGAAFPLWLMLYRRLRLRPRFLAERPGKQRLRPCRHKPDPRKPADELSLGAFLLSLVFFMPLVPLVGGLLGLAVVATRQWRRGQRLVRLGFAAAPLGLLVSLAQVVLLVSATRLF